MGGHILGEENMTKAQRCPLCGNGSQELYGEKYRCFSPSCYLGGSGMLLETWNRIRIAPDDKEVPSWQDETDFNDFHCVEEEWMNPQYPREAENEQDK